MSRGGGRANGSRRGQRYTCGESGLGQQWPVDCPSCCLHLDWSESLNRRSYRVAGNETRTPRSGVLFFFSLSRCRSPLRRRLALAMLLVVALLLAQWVLTLLSLRLQARPDLQTPASFPLWPAVAALHLQLNHKSSATPWWRDADWLGKTAVLLVSAAIETLFRKAYSDRLTRHATAPAPPREAPSIAYRYKMVSPELLSLRASSEPTTAVRYLPLRCAQSPAECDEHGRV